jgi:aryl-alcohol dehydrogenase-like predicted oxidoreductase
MEYRELGRTGVKISALTLGTMTFGEQNTEAEGHAQMDYALERGINLFDAAEIYPIPPKPETQGRTEEIIGTWLAGRKNTRAVYQGEFARKGLYSGQVSTGTGAGQFRSGS